MEPREYFSSGYFIYLFIFLAAATFFALYLLRVYLPVIFRGKINVNSFRKYFTITEGIVWILFLLGGAFFFLKHNLVFSAILFLLLLVLFYWYSRFVFRDYVAGVVFKAENRFLPDEIIEVDGQVGKIKKFHYRNVEIETENGKMILLPNSMLLGIISSPQNISETVLNFSFETELPSAQPFDEVAVRLKRYIFSLPWAVLKNEPKIQLIRETPNSYFLKITMFSFDEKYFQLMRMQVEEFIKHNYSPPEES